MHNVNNSATPGDTHGAKAFTRLDDSLLQSVSWICHHYGLGKTDEGLLAGLPRSSVLTPSLALNALENAGLTGGLVQRALQELPAQIMPVLLIREGSAGCVLLGRREVKNSEGKKSLLYQVILPEVSAAAVELPHEELAGYYSGYAILVKPDARVMPGEADSLPKPEGHWLFSTLWRYRRYYRSAALAAVLINVLALASIFFTMNVYDRVIPNQAFVTLWSLAAGVSIAMLFEAVTRFVRAHLIDVAGKKADLVLGAVLFRQALAVQMEHKPASAGSFANQIREFESVRDFIASATLAAISDLPFVLLFVAVIFVIGGPLAWIPLLIIPVIVIISVAIQWPLARIMKENLRESSLKQGVLIESIEGMETLKATAGESWMQRRWQNFSALQSASGMKSKRFSSMATGVTTFVQQFQTVLLIVTGVYLIDAGTLTMGALIATVMLSSRCTAPLAQVVGLAVRFQQAKAALSSLNKLMDMPTDRDVKRDYLPQPDITGSIRLQDICFSYPAPPMQPNPEILKGISLSIQAGERVAIIGRIGSGKSTLLRLIARLYQPVKGQMFADDLDVNQIDPADWRKAVGFVGQQARLFHGTLRENIMIGNQNATARALLQVLKLTGLDGVAARHPAGINLPVGEGGEGLSGGQRQLVALARTLLATPSLLLMDEPTSAMDSQTERQFITQLGQAVHQQTLIVVTHRPSMLALVDRIIVIEDGKVALDGPKERVLKALQGSPEQKSSPGKPAGKTGVPVPPEPATTATV
ncbi:type I secretion system permease/ATPase [Pantoea sp. Pa-EAmG]|uniref:type I secretion system permease/ATPase n=1 Tax=Pantoea sp. Pa-EAmG TaxID=3043311 RepID=UPI0024AF30C1|nr:type I secretion system permease/ATPase [Pantoea sp. Pa-EAmG]MDI6958272.1 type I secretion system permease/ATPase [Pantoea sp. Pa-EAmG]